MATKIRIDRVPAGTSSTVDKQQPTVSAKASDALENGSAEGSAKMSNAAPSIRGLQSMVRPAAPGQRHKINEALPSDTPPYVVLSPYTIGALPCTGWRNKVPETGRAQTAIDRYGLDVTHGVSGASAPSHIAGSTDKSKVPNILHWVWTGAELYPDDFYSLVRVATEHPEHTLKIWTDRPDRLRRSLDQLSQKKYPFDQNERAANFETITAFKKRLQIGSINDLFNENGLDRDDNDRLRAIVMREANGLYRNYAAAGDVIRLMTLEKFGGSYLDMDNRSLEGTLTDVKTPKGTVFYGNGLISSTAQSPFIRKALMEIIDNYKYGVGKHNEELKKSQGKGYKWVGEGDASWQAKRMPGAIHENHQFLSRVGLTSTLSGPRLLAEVARKEGAQKEYKSRITGHFPSGGHDWGAVTTVIWAGED
jgi:hypothetical protein